MGGSRPSARSHVDKPFMSVTHDHQCDDRPSLRLPERRIGARTGVIGAEWGGAWAGGVPSSLGEGSGEVMCLFTHFFAFGSQNGEIGAFMGRNLLLHAVKLLVYHLR